MKKNLYVVIIVVSLALLPFLIACAILAIELNRFGPSVPWSGPITKSR